MLTETTGDLFTVAYELNVDAIAHGVNCQGAMHAGIADKFRRKWPDMFEQYRILCNNKNLKPGQAFIYKTNGKFIYNLATQQFVGPNAKLEYVHDAFTAMQIHALKNNVSSLAIPRIAAGIGGLNWDDVRNTIEHVCIDINVIAVEWNK